MTLETLIQRRVVANEEYVATQKRIQELAKAHGEAVNELVKREGQIITLNQLIDELSPKPQVTESESKLELVPAKGPLTKVAKKK